MKPPLHQLPRIFPRPLHILQEGDRLPQVLAQAFVKPLKELKFPDVLPIEKEDGIVELFKGLYKSLGEDLRKMIAFLKNVERSGEDPRELVERRLHRLTP